MLIIDTSLLDVNPLTPVSQNETAVFIAAEKRGQRDRCREKNASSFMLLKLHIFFKIVGVGMSLKNLCRCNLYVIELLVYIMHLFLHGKLGKDAIKNVPEC